MSTYIPSIKPEQGHGLATLVDLLRFRATQQPDEVAYIFLLDGEHETEEVTYGQLDRAARRIASSLERFKLESPAAVLLYNPGLEFISAFFGCLYAGVIAIPTYLPPRQKKMEGIYSILSDAGAKLILTSLDLVEDLRQHSEVVDQAMDIIWQATDWLKQGHEEDWIFPSISKDSYAFFQYTSGSTHSPKGVMVTHDNILENEAVIRQAFRHDDQTIGLGWLPHYHDMGLIGNILQTMFIGRPCVLMSPFHFIQRPARWLKAISHFKATSSGGPNFAYELCVRKVRQEQLSELDLSTWKVAFTGAEAIRWETLQRFSEKFSSCGFDPASFYPCYGLAESTLFVTGSRNRRGFITKHIRKDGLRLNKVICTDASSAESITLIGCGNAWMNHQVLIVDPDERVGCESDRIGEIWIRGSSIAKGYWNRSDQTEYAFSAYLSDSGDGPFLRTGDLGFIQDDNLFITGRIKDIIIIRGQNYYPHEIEVTVEKSCDGLSPNGGAAFSIEAGGEERLVIVQEVERTYLKQLDFDQVVEVVRSRVLAAHGLRLHSLVLIKPVTIPKTSSGKVKRGSCRTAYLGDHLAVVHTWTNPSPAS